MYVLCSLVAKTNIEATLWGIDTLLLFFPLKLDIFQLLYTTKCILHFRYKMRREAPKWSFLIWYVISFDALFWQTSSRPEKSHFVSGTAERTLKYLITVHSTMFGQIKISHSIHMFFDIVLGLFRVFRFERVLRCLEWFNNIKLCFIASVMKQYVRLLDTLVYYYYMCQVGRGRCKGWLVWKESAC